MPRNSDPVQEGLDARRAALRMLDSILRTGQTLASASGTAANLAPVDRALAIAIVGETLRRLPDLDAWIDGATRQPLPDDSKARMVLRLALAQKVGLGTPDHALVATALPLVDGGPRRLVHGVLGTLLRGPIPTMEPPHLPPAVEARWLDQWGSAMIDAARRQISHRPPMDLSFADADEAQAYARTHGGVSLAPGNVRLASASVTDMAGFGGGRWWVQDLAASLAARLIPAAARDVIDLCAAPGGKTMQLAAAGHRVTAIDFAKARLSRLRENLDRTALTAKLVTADALDWTPQSAPDAILLDAPCSATGTFRRHPEVLYRAGPRIIASSTEVQAKLIDRAAGWLEPGGILIYCVCSLERIEGEDIVTALLDRHPGFAIDPPQPGELPDFAVASGKGWVRILPGMLEAEGGLDGFFFARLVRRA